MPLWLPHWVYCGLRHGALASCYCQVYQSLSKVNLASLLTDSVIQQPLIPSHKRLVHFRTSMTLHWIVKWFYPHVLSASSCLYSIVDTHGAQCWGIPGVFPCGYSSHSVSVDYSQHQRLWDICDLCGGFYACVWNDEWIEALSGNRGDGGGGWCHSWWTTCHSI